MAEQAGFSGRILALDHDAEAISVLGKAAAITGSKVQGKMFAFGDPLPFVADVVFCGAIIHWVFCLTANFEGNFTRILEYIRAAAKTYLMIEWVDPSDFAIKQFKHISKCTTKQKDAYTFESFHKAVSKIGRVTSSAKFAARTVLTIDVREKK